MGWARCGAARYRRGALLLVGALLWAWLAGPGEASAEEQKEGDEGRWCAPELTALDGEVCWAEPRQRAPGPRTLVIFLHGVVQPGSGWQHNQQRAAARAAEQHGFTALMPRGRRGNGPEGMRDWWTWPAGAAHAASEDEVIGEWARAREAIEKNGARFERVWIMGFSNGAYFATSLAMRARLGPGREITADGFAAFAGGDGAPYLEKIAKKQPHRAPFFVGWGGLDKAHRDQVRLARMLARLRWPSRSAGAPKAGHAMVDRHVAEAVRFLDRSKRAAPSRDR